MTNTVFKEKSLIWSTDTGSPISKKNYFYWQTQVLKGKKGPEKAASKMQGSKVNGKTRKKKKKITQVY